LPIDTSGQWWRGSEPADLDDYIAEYSAQSYPVSRTVHAQCDKDGGLVFSVRVDDEEGYVDRTCLSCGTTFAMLDSEDYKEDATPEAAACPCGGETFNVAVGFALRDDGSIKWVYSGLRCVTDGTLGVYGDWKIDYEPSEQLFGRV
jgi:hypothetical protein